MSGIRTLGSADDFFSIVSTTEFMFVYTEEFGVQMDSGDAFSRILGERLSPVSSFVYYEMGWWPGTESYSITQTSQSR